LKKLLIIENDVDTIEIVSIILEEYNDYTVVKSQIKLPVEEIADINPNVIVMDYLLLDGYGSELCSELKENPATKHLPVIIMSASTNLGKVIKECHADAFLPKPFDLTELVELVEKVAI
jgi:DNA-binding response OmpR family regulator